MAATTTTDAISIELPKDLRRDLKSLADRTGRTEAEIVVEAVERHLVTLARPRPAAVGTYSDPDVTSENLDDWLAATWKPDWE